MFLGEHFQEDKTINAPKESTNPKELKDSNHTKPRPPCIQLSWLVRWLWSTSGSHSGTQGPEVLPCADHLSPTYCPQTSGSPGFQKLVLEFSPNIWHWANDGFLRFSLWGQKAFIHKVQPQRLPQLQREPLRNSCINPLSWTHLGGCSFDEHVDPQVLRKCWKPFCFCEQQVSPLHHQSWCWSLHLVDGEPWNRTHTVRQISHIINSYTVLQLLLLGNPMGCRILQQCFI